MMRMITKEEVVEGIVVRNKEYKNASSLVTIYTEEFGKMVLIARGVKKLNSKNAGACQSLTLSEFTLVPRAGLSTLIKATYLDLYLNIKDNLLVEAVASYCLEYILLGTEENDPNREIYHNFKLTLAYLNQGYDPLKVLLFFQAFVLKINGCRVEVDSCVSCGTTKGIKGVSLVNGGFVCHKCLSAYDYQFEKDTLIAFRHLNKLRLDEIDKLKISDRDMRVLLPVMEAFVEEYIGLKFKSKKFLKQLL